MKRIAMIAALAAAPASADEAACDIASTMTQAAIGAAGAIGVAVTEAKTRDEIVSPALESKLSEIMGQLLDPVDIDALFTACPGLGG